MTTSKLAAIAATKSRKGGSTYTAWTDEEVKLALAALETDANAYADKREFPPFAGKGKKPTYNAYASGFYLAQRLCRTLLNDPTYSGKGAFDITVTAKRNGTYTFTIAA